MYTEIALPSSTIDEEEFQNILGMRAVLTTFCRLSEELESQQVMSKQQAHCLAAMLAAIDELQERREVSDSARGRLRGILAAPLGSFGGGEGGGGVRSSGLIRQSSRLSGVLNPTP